MNFKQLIPALVLSVFTTVISAQEAPAPKHGPCPAMRQIPLSPEARMKIDAIRKADLEKQREKMETMRKLLEAYKADKSEANKSKIMEQLGKCFDERIAAQEKRIAQEKADKNKILAKHFENLLSGKPCPMKMRGPRGGHPGFDKGRKECGRGADMAAPRHGHHGPADRKAERPE